MTINVSKDAENAINAAVQSGQFSSAGEMVEKLVREYAQRHRPQQSAATEPLPSSASSAEKPIWEVLDELRKAVPAAELARLPVDGASQHDHYIYGTPKRPTR